MTLRRWLSAALLFAATSATGAADRRSLGFAPPPGWVQPVPVENRSGPAPEGVEGGIDYLLVDRQIRVGPSGEERYGHYAKRIVNEAGLETASQVSVSFDPSYQRLTLHTVRVRRAGAVLERLQPARVELLQRESDLESQIYDGSLSAVLFVPDLRVGDVLEYAFTVTGANPVLGGRYTGSFDIEWSVPLYRLRHRLLWPGARARPLVRNHGTSIAPEVTEDSRSVEYRWEIDDPAAVGDPGPVPPWFTKWAWVQISEFRTWREVADWARPLYRPSGLSSDMERQLAAWRRLPNPSARARAALRFVQDEVRYVGIEMGTGSHRPSAPDVVFSRRFGDCKDKSLLLVTLLRSLGVRAVPALVHTGTGAGLDDWLPTPYAFNHVVVRFELDGQILWVDPTWSTQGGPLERIHFPAFERALLVDAGVDALTEISAAPPPAPLQEVSERYVIASDEAVPVDFTVETRLRGEEADRYRLDLLHRGREQIGKRYLDFYATTWPELRSAAPLEVVDDREANEVVVRERYSIPRFWKEESAGGRRAATLVATTLSSALRRPDLASHAPLAVAHPTFLSHETRIALPGDWGLLPEQATLETPALRFSYEAHPESDGIRLRYELRSRGDVVHQKDVAAHVAQVEAMAQRLRFRLPLPSGGHLGGTNWTAALALWLALGGASLAGLVVARSASIGRARAAQPVGVKASLFLAGLLVGAAVLHAGALLRAWRLCRPAAWAQRAFPDGTLHHPGWPPVLLSQLVLHAVPLIGALTLGWLLLRRRSSARPLFVAWACLQTATLFVLTAATVALPGGQGAAGHAALRDALLSLGPLLAGTVAALLRSRAQRPAPVVSSTSRPRWS